MHSLKFDTRYIKNKLYQIQYKDMRLWEPWYLYVMVTQVIGAQAWTEIGNVIC